MALIGNIPNTAESQSRMGFEHPEFCGIPAPEAQLTFHPLGPTSDISQDAPGVEVTNISSSGVKPRTLPGKALTGGTMSEQNDAHGFIPALVAPLRFNDGGVDLGGGAHQHTYALSLGTGTPFNYTLQQDPGDKLSLISAGVGTQEFTVTIASNAAMVIGITSLATYSTEHDTGVERHPNPTASTLFARNQPPQWLERADGTQGDLYAVLRGEETGADGITRLVFQATIGRPGPITALWSITGATATLTADTPGAGLATSEVFKDDVLDVDGEPLVVLSTPDDDTIILTTNHTAGATAATPTREYGTEGFFLVQIGRFSDTSYAVWNKVNNSTGGFMGNRELTGSTVEIHATGATAIVQPVAVALTDDISVTVGTTTVVGEASSLFLAELYVGGLITTAGGQSRRVATITSNTDATIAAGVPWTTTEAIVSGTSTAPPLVALSGTYTTAGTTALTASGGAMLTELSIGSTVRTLAGEVRRIATISDDDTATVTRAFTGSEVAVAATTDFEWQFPRAQSSFAQLIPLSGLFSELNTEVFVSLPSTDLPEEKIEIAETATFTFTAATQGKGGIGGKQFAAVVPQGTASGNFAVVINKVSLRLSRKAVEAGTDIRFRFVSTTGKVIGTTNFEYAFEWVIHGRLEGKPTWIPDADTNQGTLAGSLNNNLSDVDFPDLITLITTSDVADPTAVTPFL